MPSSLRSIKAVVRAVEGVPAFFAGAAGEGLWGMMFAEATGQHEKARRAKSLHPASEGSRQRIRLWQAVASLVHFVPGPDVAAVVAAVLDILHVSS